MMRGWIVYLAAGGSLDFTLFWGSWASFLFDGNGNITQERCMRPSPTLAPAASYSGQWSSQAPIVWLLTIWERTITIIMARTSHRNAGFSSSPMETAALSSTIRTAPLSKIGSVAEAGRHRFLPARSPALRLRFVGVLGIPLDVLQARQHGGRNRPDGNGNITGAR